jgi:hypothetical protein
MIIVPPLSGVIGLTDSVMVAGLRYLPIPWHIGSSGGLAEGRRRVGILAGVSRTLELIAGLMLLAIAALILASDLFGDILARIAVPETLIEYWPMIPIGLSLFFIVPAAVGTQHRRLRAGMVIPGAMLAVVGIALLYTSLNDRWGAWSYLWTSLPFGLGMGMYAAGWIADAPAFKWIGSAVAAGAVVAYLALATAFGGEAFRVIGGLGILALGAALTFGGLAERLSRKSPTA